MACRVGMTSRVSERKADWQRKHKNFRNWRILKTGLTYHEALQYEAAYARRNGCVFHGGGQRKAGRVYSVYRFDY